MKEFTREKNFKTRSVNGTLAIAATIAEILAAPRVVILRGDLGAGKTTLVKGWLDSLGAARPDEVTSPTFTLIHEYEASRGKVYHLDLYRLESEQELAALGIDELAAEPGALLLIEWGEKFPSLVARADGEVAMAQLEADERSLAIRWNA